MADSVTIDAAAYEELRRQAAAAPALVEQARLAVANPVARAETAWQPVTAFAAPRPAGEPTEAEWSDFTYRIGLGGNPLPRPLTVVDTQSPNGVPPALSHLSGPSEADMDRFVAGLNLGGRR